jgi:hypothetical protein
MVGIAGMAAGAMLVSPVIALLASPLASADTTDVTVTNPDVTTYGPYTFDGYTDTFSINTSTDAFDNYLTGAFDGSNFDLDLYSPATGDYDVLLTDPGLFQLGVDDTAGVLTYTDSFTPADFINPDIGLTDIGGAVAADAVGGLSF